MVNCIELPYVEAQTWVKLDLELTASSSIHFYTKRALHLVFSLSTPLALVATYLANFHRSLENLFLSYTMKH